MTNNSESAEIELPYYYKFEVIRHKSYVICHGVFESNGAVEIRRTGVSQFNISHCEFTYYDGRPPSSIWCEPEYKSTAQEFEGAREAMIAALNKTKGKT